MLIPLLFRFRENGTTSNRPLTRRLAFTAVLTLLLASLSANTAWAWRVADAFRIPQGIEVMTVVEGRLWCGQNSDDSTIVVLNPADGSEFERVAAPDSRCRGIAFSAGSVWFLGRERLFRLNAQGDFVSSMNASPTMRGLTAAENGLWMVDESENDLVLINFQGGEIRRIDIRVSDVADIFFSGTHYWLTNPFESFIHKLDLNGASIDIFPAPSNTPTAITGIDDDIYLIDDGDDQNNDLLYRIEPGREQGPRLLPGSRLHDFGMANVHGARNWDLTIFNIGGADLNIDSVAFQNGNACFRRGQLPQQMIVRPGQYLQVRISFAPTDYGRFVDTLIITSNDPYEPELHVAFSGIGVFGERVLEVAPVSLNFGTVRADPERDGSQQLSLALVNQGADNLSINSLGNGIPEIFRVEIPALPVVMESAETLNVRIWFEPHRGIQYLDTLVIRSNAVSQYDFAYLTGEGDAREVPAGEILWEAALTGGNDIEAFVSNRDLNDDGVREVVAFAAGVGIYCLNGFGSDVADLIWIQTFEGTEFVPAGLASQTSLLADLPLSRHNSTDILVATGGESSAICALEGNTGHLLWLTTASELLDGARVAAILPGQDCNGDGSIDPAALVLAGDEARAARLDGVTGRPIWIGQAVEATDIAQLSDLTGDGIGELIDFHTNGHIGIISGADGWSIRSFDIPAFNALIPAKSEGRERTSLLFCAPQDGGITAIDHTDGRTAWAIDEIETFGQLGALTKLAYQNHNGVSTLAGSDAEGNLFLVRNPVAGSDAIAESVTDSPITTLSWAPPLHPEDAPALLVGDESGRVVMVESAELGLLWEYQAEGEAGVARMVRSFDDVDLGGTEDVIALFENGALRCLSSGGDFSSVDRSINLLPISPVQANLHPNPFNGEALLAFSLPVPSDVEVKVYDLTGRELLTRSLGSLEPGRHSLRLDRNDFTGAGGVIFVAIKAGSKTSIVRGVFLK